MVVKSGGAGGGGAGGGGGKGGGGGERPCILRSNTTYTQLCSHTRTASAPPGPNHLGLSWLNRETVETGRRRCEPQSTQQLWTAIAHNGPNHPQFLNQAAAANIDYHSTQWPESPRVVVVSQTRWRRRWRRGCEPLGGGADAVLPPADRGRALV